MIVITDLLRNPIDEGAKKTSLHVIRELCKQGTCLVFSLNTDDAFEFIHKHAWADRLFIDRSFIRMLQAVDDKNILYIPEASLTPATFFRSALLTMLTGKQVKILALQQRYYHPVMERAVHYFQPATVITQSKGYAQYLDRLGIRNFTIPLGVETDRFQAASEIKKEQLRERYGIAQDRTVLLHVGHISKTRNLEWLIEVKRELPDIEVAVVGSTYSLQDLELHQALLKAEIRVFSGYLPEVQELYNLSDYYVFPVMKHDAAIGTPLSVLEAMACNLRVAATRFGSLPDTFQEDACFRYISHSKDIVSMLKAPDSGVCDNRSKVLPFSWSNVARQVKCIVEPVSC